MTRLTSHVLRCCISKAKRHGVSQRLMREAVAFSFFYARLRKGTIALVNYVRGGVEFRVLGLASWIFHLFPSVALIWL